MNVAVALHPVAIEDTLRLMDRKSSMERHAYYETLITLFMSEQISSARMNELLAAHDGLRSYASMRGLRVSS